ncbi:unnamed protein product, partial [Candidula unifasciata]
LSEDDQETETTEADSEVQIVTECWVEPQYGICCNNTPERQHFNGLTYLDIAKAFYPRDYECVSSLTTFEHLVYLCENSAIPSPDVVVSRQSSPPSTPGNRFTRKKEEGYRSEPTVNIIPFPFDLQSLLPRSQQAEILFSTFVIGDGNTSSENVVLDPKEPSELLLSLFYDKLKEAHNNEILLSADDCQCPMWKCYVKKDDVTDHLLLTFVPACFDDLLLLNPSPAEASPEEGDTGASNFPVSIGG